MLILIYTKIRLHFAAVCTSGPCTIQELPYSKIHWVPEVFFSRGLKAEPTGGEAARKTFRAGPKQRLDQNQSQTAYEKSPRVTAQIAKCVVTWIVSKGTNKADISHKYRYFSKSPQYRWYRVLGIDIGPPWLRTFIGSFWSKSFGRTVSLQWHGHRCQIWVICWERTHL